MISNNKKLFLFHLKIKSKLTRMNTGKTNAFAVEMCARPNLRLNFLSLDVASSFLIIILCSSSSSCSLTIFFLRLRFIAKEDGMIVSAGRLSCISTDLVSLHYFTYFLWKVYGAMFTEKNASWDLRENI